MVEEIKEMPNLVTLQKGDTVRGRVSKIEDGQAIIDIGYKYDGILPIGEISALRIENVSDALSVGDELDLKVLRIHDDEGKLILSKRAIDSMKSWDHLQKLFETGEPFDVKVADVVKGGLVVDVGVRAFIPASLVERHFVEDFSGYKGNNLQVKIVELDRADNKVILSHKAVLDTEFESNKQNVIDNLQAGEVLDGVIQRLTPFGAFVDIGGIDGLVHISELAWHRVEDPSEVVNEGDKVKVKVLKVDPEKGRISLSLKETQPGPWSGVEKQVKPGEIVTGKVRRLVSFGAFVEVLPGVEGLVHISQISNRHIANPQEVLEVGQEIKVKVLDVNPNEQRISLSIRDAESERGHREVERYVEKQQNNQGTGMTLGDMFGDLFKKNQ